MVLPTHVDVATGQAQVHATTVGEPSFAVVRQAVEAIGFGVVEPEPAPRRLELTSPQQYDFIGTAQDSQLGTLVNEPVDRPVNEPQNEPAGGKAEGLQAHLLITMVHHTAASHGAAERIVTDDGPVGERLWLCVLGLALTIPLLLPMLGVPLGLPVDSGRGGNCCWCCRRLSWPVSCVGASWQTTMDTLIALGAILGLVLGVWALRGSQYLPFEISKSLVAFCGLAVTSNHKRATGPPAVLLTLCAWRQTWLRW